MMLARPGRMWQCEECGFIINGGPYFEDGREHECDPRSVVRRQLSDPDAALARFLSTPEGMFEEFYARRRLT